MIFLAEGNHLSTWRAKVHKSSQYWSIQNLCFVTGACPGFRPKHQRQPVLPLHGENESPGWKACGLWASCEGLLSGQGRVASPHRLWRRFTSSGGQKLPGRPLRKLAATKAEQAWWPDTWYIGLHVLVWTCQDLFFF